MTTQRTDIKRLAKLSGVSIGTVSRALNGYSDVSEETRRRILQLAEELDYTPAAAARTLVTQRSHVIGVVLETGEGHPDIQHPFFHGVLVGLKTFMGRAGYDLLLFAGERPGNGFGPHSYLKRARHHNVDGVVLMGIDRNDDQVLRLTRSGMPAVGVDVVLQGPRATYATSDNEAGARQAVRHLHELGHRRIATITGPLETLAGDARFRGYRQELQALGIAPRDEYVTYGDFYLDSGREAVERLLALEEPPTAIFAASDLMALGAVRGAESAAVRVPHDLSVVGFDDIAVAELVEPALTTLRQDKDGLGAAACQALIAQIETTADPGPPVTLPVDLIVRGSTAPPAS